MVRFGPLGFVGTGRVATVSALRNSALEIPGSGSRRMGASRLGRGIRTILSHVTPTVIGVLR